MLRRVIIFAGLGLLAAACAPSKGPAVPSATVQTIAVVAATEPKSTTVPSSSSSTTTTTTTITTAASSTIPETPVAKDPDFDAIEQALKEGQMEYADQLTTNAPDFDRLSEFFDRETANSLVTRIRQIASSGRRIKSGSIGELKVTQVSPTNLPELKLARVCYQNNAREYLVGDPSRDDDDQLVQDKYEVVAYDIYVLNKQGVWRAGRKTNLSESSCAGVFA